MVHWLAGPSLNKLIFSDNSSHPYRGQVSWSTRLVGQPHSAVVIQKPRIIATGLLYKRFPLVPWQNAGGRRDPAPDLANQSLYSKVEYTVSEFLSLW